MEVIASRGNFYISSDFGTSVAEGTNPVGANSKVINFAVSQNTQLYNRLYWQIEPISGGHYDFWEEFFSNRVGGEPADAFANSGFVSIGSGGVELKINPDSFPEPIQKFAISFYQSSMDPYYGAPPVISATFSIIDDDAAPGRVTPSNLLSFGTFTHSTFSTGGTIYAMYDGLLGRAPDVLGLEGWADAFERGLSARDMAAGFLASAEGQARAGALDNGAFVTQLYEATLHRQPDAVGFKGWVDALNGGMSRADVAVGFALSEEHLNNIKPTFDAGYFVPDKTAADVARLYYGVLDRAPDAAGLKGWTAAIDQGSTLKSVANGFADSLEFNQKYGSVPDATFVDQLYLNTLDRHADAVGLAGWTNALANGATRGDIAMGVALSFEAEVHYIPQIEAGWHLA